MMVIERGLVMLLHSLIIGMIAYLLMIFLLRQPYAKAEDRSILITGLVLVYMVLFGHGLPGQINPLLR